MTLTAFDIILIGMVYFISAATTYFYLNKSKINEKNSLQTLENNVMMEKAVTNNTDTDCVRTCVIDQLSRQKLVYSEEDNCWIRLKQIN